MAGNSTHRETASKQPEAVHSWGALLVAAGQGTRFGGEPKQFATLGGRWLLEHALQTLVVAEGMKQVAVLVPPASCQRVRQHLAGRRWPGRAPTIMGGGASRQESVWLGLAALDECSHVLVHDAARPFVTPELIAAAREAASRNGAASVAMPVTDTLMRVASKSTKAQACMAQGTVDRTDMWAIQTPQAFAVALLRQAHAQAQADGFAATDDATLVLRLGRAVELVAGAWWNIKVTEPGDLERAAILLQSRPWERP